MTKYQRTPETIFALIDRDVVALHVGRGNCFGMEDVTAEVWGLLEQPATLDDLCTHLLDRYAVDAEQCRAEVQLLIGQMIDEGLVSTVA